MERSSMHQPLAAANSPGTTRRRVRLVHCAPIHAPYAFGRACHFGKSSKPANIVRPARNVNTSAQLQPNCSASPLLVPPTTAPTDPQPLIQPAAVEVPRFEPKSAAAAPE